jgi:iron complex outermembrane receptor protein
VTVFGNYAYGALPQPPPYFLPPALPCAFIMPKCIVQNGITPVDIKTYSVFGQARWDIVERLELAGGLRYTDEKRVESPFAAATGVATVVPTPELHTRRPSPEVTLTYRPTDDLTMFAAWKRGFKSGSFSVATPAVAGVDNSFSDEKVNGGELGLKSRLLDRQLAVNVAGYYYDYNGLQVGVISPPQNGVPVIQTVNAASARTYGIDLDGTFRPREIPGLGFNAAVNWNHGRYQQFNNAPCWGGQLVSEGCNQSFNPQAGPPGPTGKPIGAYTAQNLSGTPLIRAPQWQATLGFDYEMRLASDYSLVFTNSNELSSRYVTYLAVNRPNNDNYQGAFVKVDLGVTLQGPKNLWEVALIGKNINDKLTSGNCVSSPLETEIVPNPSGLTTRSPFGIDPAGCFVDPGREVWLRFTMRPFAAR